MDLDLNLERDPALELDPASVTGSEAGSMINIYYSCDGSKFHKTNMKTTVLSKRMFKVMIIAEVG